VTDNAGVVDAARDPPGVGGDDPPTTAGDVTGE